MNRNQFNQERLAMVGAAFETGYMLGKFGIGDRPNARPTIDVKTEKQPMIHKVSSIPIMLDNISAPPDKVKEFDGQPLYYVMDKQALADGVLQVFTTPEKAQEYRNQAIANLKKSTSQESVNSQVRMAAGAYFAGSVDLYEHIYFQGNKWHFEGEWGYIPDFRYVNCFLWWCANINDKVSSLMTNIWSNIPGWRWPVYTVLYEHINYNRNQVGSEFWADNPATYPDLSIYGWNDIASSMLYFTANY